MKKSKGFIVSTSVYIALMVIFAALLISFGYKKYSANSADHSEIFQQKWQTYQNPTIGYRLEYPSDWQCSPTSNSSVVYFKSQNIQEVSEKFGMDVVRGAKITVNFTSVPASQDIEQAFFSYFKEIPKGIKNERVIFSSQTAIAYNYSQGTQNVKGIFFLHKQKPATIFITTSSAFNTNYADIFDRFLSSFKLEQT